MISRRPIGYVVEIDGPNILANLLEEARGHVAGHRDGLSTVEQPGDLVGIEAGSETIVTRIQTVAFAEPKELHPHRRATATSSMPEPLRQLRGRVIGCLRRESGQLIFVAQDWRLPVLGASVYPLSTDEAIATIGVGGTATDQVVLGADSRNPGIPVRANMNELLGRHLAILGATGQGKTHFVAAVLQMLSKNPRSRIVVFDVNGEYEQAFAPLGKGLQTTVLGRRRAGEAATVRKDLRIPYYALGRHGLARLLLPSERAQMPALRFAIEHLPFIEADPNAAKACGEQSFVLVDDCRPDGAHIASAQLDKIRKGDAGARRAEVWPHMRGLSCLIAESYALRRGRNNQPERDSFHYSHVHSLVNRIRSLIDDPQFANVVDVTGGKGASPTLDMTEESRYLVDSVFGPQNRRDGDWNVHVIDLSGLTQDLMPFVLGSLLEMFAAELFRRGPGNTHPTLLVLEEAHHYLRQLPGDSESGQHVLAYERLAKEGRKFGLSLLVSTQRPSEVSSTVLAQCGTWAAFRLSNEGDQKSVGAAAEAAGLNVTKQLSGLGRGEAIVFGAAMPIPTRVAVVRPDPKPKSSDAPFVSEWGPKPVA